MQTLILDLTGAVKNWKENLKKACKVGLLLMVLSKLLIFIPHLNYYTNSSSEMFQTDST